MIAYDQYGTPPGTGPFRIRGNAYRGHLEYTEKHIKGGIPAMLAAFGRPELQAFFAQRFFSSSWYDIFPLIAAGDACAQLVDMSFDDFVRMRARWQANSDLGGIYKVMLQLVSEQWLANRIPRGISDYFDFGGCVTKVEGKNHVSVVSQPIPDLLMRWVLPVAEVYPTVALELAGADGVKVRSLKGRVGELLYGYSCSSLRCDYRWS